MLIKLSALILAAILGAGLLLFACVPTSPVLLAAAPSAVCTENNAALKNVPFVAIPFNASNNQIPTAQSFSTRPVNSGVQADLAAAFAAASPNFKAQLCNLDGIFIDPTGCADPGPGNTYNPTQCQLTGTLIAAHSWGFRTYNQTNPANSGKKYVGVSLALWNNNNAFNYHWQCPTANACAEPFSVYYTGETYTVIHLPGSAAYSFTVGVAPNSFATSSAMTALATLAHEFGHVYWFTSFVQTPGGSFNNGLFCNGAFYPGGNWQSVAVSVPGGLARWVNFGDIVGFSGNPVPTLPGALHQILSTGNWASALAAFSFTEDFVETFELKQLLNANPGLTSLQIVSTIGSNTFTDNIVPSGSGLSTKLACFS